MPILQEVSIATHWFPTITESFIQGKKKERELGRLTSIVGDAGRVHPPRERRVQVELDIGAVQGRLAGGFDIGGEDGVVEAGAGMVGVDIEIIMLGVGGARGLEVEGLGRFCVPGSMGGDGGCCDGGDQQSERRKQLHFDEHVENEGQDCLVGMR